MAKLIVVEENSGKSGDTKYCEELEAGNILFFAKIPFPFFQEDIDFLLSQRQTCAKNRKNIAYKPHLDKITNFEKKSPVETERIHKIMKKYSHCIVRFLSTLLSPYASSWKLDYASFRPFQEKGRKLRIHARNDLLHTDAFPSRPMHGDRILRFFTNISPSQSRRWITAHSFKELVEKFGGTKELPFPKPIYNTPGKKLFRKVKKSMYDLGFPLKLRSPYDHFMLSLHHFIKKNEAYQKDCPKDHWEFAPRCCWMVFTDQTTHAALAGQYALEQTLIIPRHSLLKPEEAPASILERLMQTAVVDHIYAS